MNSKKQQAYASRDKEAMDLFHVMSKEFIHYLPSMCDEETARAIATEAQANFETLLPQLPNIGEKSINLKNVLLEVSICIAYYIPWKGKGMSVETFGKLLYTMRTDELNAMTEEQRKTVTEEVFSSKKLQEWQEWTEWSQKRTCPYNWVGYYIEGDGKTFDYGTDYTECGLVKVCQKCHVPELVPFLCLLDFPPSKCLGLGLFRTKTLAMGDDVCDFRYKRGRPTVQGWDTEIEKVRTRIDSMGAVGRFQNF